MINFPQQLSSSPTGQRRERMPRTDPEHCPAPGRTVCAEKSGPGEGYYRDKTGEAMVGGARDHSRGDRRNHRAQITDAVTLEAT